MNIKQFHRYAFVRWIFTIGVICMAPTLFADEQDEYQNQWGPEVGSTIPALSVLDTNGESTTFDDLKGENGLALFFVRSADW